MQAFGPFLNGLGNPHCQLWDHILGKTLIALEKHARRKAFLASPEDVRRRADAVREAFLTSIGGLPDFRGPLNARVRGVVDRGNYRIEKIIFESQPRVYVTSLLYVPAELKGRAPAVLFVSGHHREAKGAPEYQRVCHDLAINGFVTLAVDPSGQGERVTHLNPDTGAMEIGWGTTEHSYQGQQCALTGTSIARYFLFDALRAIDYLQSRPEVDPDRLGVTGNSGGGTQTTLICMSGDDRVKAAVPCTYVTSREHYGRTGQPQDAEQIQFAMTKNGINFDDMFLPFAPRPLCIGAVEDDFFNPEGTELVYDRLRRVYDLLGCSDRVSRIFAPGMHKYCRVLREAAVNWFRVHLAGQDPTFVSTEDESIVSLPDSSLWCTTKGHVRTEFPDAVSPYDLNLQAIPVRRRQGRPERLRARVIQALGIGDRLAHRVEQFPRVAQTQDHELGMVESVVFISESHVWVSGCLVRPQSPSEEVVVYLGDGGTLNLDGALTAIRPELEAGRAGFIFDVRGVGSVRAHDISSYSGPFPCTLFDTQAWMAWMAYCVGESVLGMRVFDVLRAFEYLRTRCRFKRVGVRAAGLEPALWGYLAAAIDPDIDPVHISGLIPSFEAVVRTEVYRRDFLPTAVVHGVLHFFDLPDLELLFKGRTCTIEPAPVD